MKIRISAILSVLTYLMTFFVYNNTIKYVFIVATAICLVIGFDYKSFKKHSKINTLSVIFCAVTVIFSIANRHNSFERNVVLASIVFAVVFLEFLFSMEYISDRGKIDLMIKIYFYLTLAVALLTDFFILTKGASDGLYLVGTKFTVAYTHFNLIGFYYLYNKTRSQKSILNKRDRLVATYVVYLIMILLTAFISIKTDCMTGVVGLAMLVLMLLLSNHASRFFINRITLFCSTAISFWFLWIYDVILQNRVISNFVTNNLNTNLTLTGRTEIYDSMPRIMSGHWLYGYGYGSAFDVCSKRIGYSDTQNALMQVMLEIGVVGSVLLIIWQLYVFFRLKRTPSVYSYSLPIVVLIYVYILIGTIEITYNIQYYCLFLMIYALANDWKLSKTNEDIDKT